MGRLEATRLKDANAAEPNGAVVRSVEFHHDGNLLLTAGLDKTIRLFQVSGWQEGDGRVMGFLRGWGCRMSAVMNQSIPSNSKIDFCFRRK